MWWSSRSFHPPIPAGGRGPPVRAGGRGRRPDSPCISGLGDRRLFSSSLSPRLHLLPFYLRVFVFVSFDWFLLGSLQASGGVPSLYLQNFTSNALKTMSGDLWGPRHAHCKFWSPLARPSLASLARSLAPRSLASHSLPLAIEEETG